MLLMYNEGRRRGRFKTSCLKELFSIMVPSDRGGRIRQEYIDLGMRAYLLSASEYTEDMGESGLSLNA